VTKHAVKNIQTGTDAGDETVQKPKIEKFVDREEHSKLNLPKCHGCRLPVFKPEEILFLDNPWHMNCFKCGLDHGQGCQRLLKKGDYNTQGNVPYCHACFQRLFGLGAARGTVLPDLKSAQYQEEAVPSLADRISFLQRRIDSESNKNSR
jgi:hypothetical protein